MWINHDFYYAFQRDKFGGVAFRPCFHIEHVCVWIGDFWCDNMPDLVFEFKTWLHKVPRYDPFIYAFNIVNLSFPHCL